MATSQAAEVIILSSDDEDIINTSTTSVRIQSLESWRNQPLAPALEAESELPDIPDVSADSPEAESYRVRLPKKPTKSAAVAATKQSKSKKKPAFTMSDVLSYHQEESQMQAKSKENVHKSSTELLGTENELKKTYLRQDKELKKAAEQQERERKKAAAQKERELKKVAEQREKELKKVGNEIRKNSKPGEAFRFMTVLVDPNVPQRECIETTLDAAGIKHSINFTLPMKNSFQFDRELVYQAMGDDMQLHKLSKFEQEKHVLVLMEPDEIVPKILAQIPGDSAPRSDDDGETDVDLIAWVTSIRSMLPGKEMTLIFYGMEDYFKKVKRSEQQQFRERVLNADADKEKKAHRKRKKDVPVITKFDFQSCLVQLQLKVGVHYRIVNSPKDLGLMIVQYTKAIADAPFKIAQREHSEFDWFALADTSGSIKVDKDGIGLRNLWLEQLQQFNKVGLDIANAIFKKYPTPRHLIEAYENCSTQEEGQAMLSGIEVITGFAPLQRTRKLGPELSRKMYRFFTSTNPERCLGSS